MRNKARATFVIASAGFAVAALCTAQLETSHPVEFSARIEVIVRTIAFDVVDAAGRPVSDVPAELISVEEDGQPQQVLEVRPGSPRQAQAVPPEGSALPRGATPTPPGARVHVLVALDPLTLGPREWAQALAQLDSAADSLVSIGPVDVVALTSPARRVVAGTHDPGSVRAALAALATEVVPLDAFYRGRIRLLRDALGGTGAFDPALGGAAAVAIDHATTELAWDEEELLRNAVSAVDAALAAVPRPTVLVWIAGGDPEPGRFVGQLVPGSLVERTLLQASGAGPGSGLWDRLSGVWAAWAGSGVRVVAWPPVQAEHADLGAAEFRRSLTAFQSLRLGFEPLALFEEASAKTSGALVRNGNSLAEALDSVRGRFMVIYQTGSERPGWRNITLRVAHPGWVVRYPTRILVPERIPVRDPAEAAPAVLAVDLTATHSASDKPGREAVALTVLVDLAPLRERLGTTSAARFVLRVLATPPHGATVAREVEVRVPRLAAEGSLRYQSNLVVPEGTSSYVVEVRELSTGAQGVAGPVEAVSGEWLATREEVLPRRGAAFSESVDVRIAQARFIESEGASLRPEDVHVRWNGREQPVIRVAGGAGSSLELGIAIDMSESVSDERDSFASAAMDAATRLLGKSDRVFRVDFGSVPRYLGSSFGEPGGLFTGRSLGSPEKTAVFDGLRYALDRFTGETDRAALIVLTDGVETFGRTGWREVEREARAKAIPIFVILAPERKQQRAAPPTLPAEALVNGPANPTPRLLTELEKDSATGEGQALTSRLALTRIAKTSGGLVISLDRARHAADVWAEIEGALVRLWVAVYEPNDAMLDPGRVEVRTASGRVLRPAR
jgi:hypothetical protein